MPLRDHFHPPLSRTRSHQEVYGGWPAVIVQQLGSVLPAHYAAGPCVRAAGQIEVDIGTFESG